MKNYYRVMLGQKSRFAKHAYEGNYIGVDHGIKMDLSNPLLSDRQAFNNKFIPKFLENHPNKTKISAGLACGVLWTIATGLQHGDIILCPDGDGSFFVGEVCGGYTYQKDQILPHRRSVNWFSRLISRNDISEVLKNSAGSISTISNITKHSNEIEALIRGTTTPIITTDETIEQPSEFALEQHLEEFLIKNWSSTELGKKYDLYEDDGEIVGRQYPCDTGLIDILAISKDKKTIVVIELKKGRASDYVVGQVQRYMGFVKEELAEKNQSVQGIIIAFEDDLNIRRALSVAPNIEFYKYKINFKLEKK
jgi:restriction system protein